MGAVSFVIPTLYSLLTTLKIACQGDFLLLLRSIVGLDRFGLNDHGGVAFLQVLGLRSHNARHIARGESQACG